jgi:hypothetical protein
MPEQYMKTIPVRETDVHSEKKNEGLTEININNQRVAGYEKLL